MSAALRGLRSVPVACDSCPAITTMPPTSTRWPRACRTIAASSAPRATCSCRFTACRSATSSLGDPYRDQCERTASLAGAKTRLAAGEWSVSFQSRFGRARWLQPYTSEVLAGHAGTRRQERERASARASRPTASRRSRKSAWRIATCSWRRAAKQYHYIAALNARADHVAALSALVRDAS